MFGLGPIELGIILIIVVVAFGSRLPKVARSLGQAKNEFTKGLSEGAKDEEAAPPADKA